MKRKTKHTTNITYDISMFIGQRGVKIISAKELEDYEVRGYKIVGALLKEPVFPEDKNELRTTI